MGIRIVIVYLDHIEKASLANGIILYKLYIDDVFVVGSAHAELRSTLPNLNSVNVNIKFIVEEPSRYGFLPFLNIKVRICNGKTAIRCYRKPSSKNVVLHSRSAHPTYMKVNVVLVKSSKRIATTNSENDESIQHILFENGCNSGETSKWRPYLAPDEMALALPYLNDHRAKRVNATVKRSAPDFPALTHPPSDAYSFTFV
ncbi:hypothetical protein Y032_0455g1769 [Ancylostoma ceylanicum]|uniref:Reverse transcriptase domain-containing protein n=1 Tax=Ancylostoma ceylanicum TaxID=53326 RepID=A0A016X072_9BILA|nr:hypothetical protein Y032_0455g1769 [Ancylostoma ceylanicum]